MNLLRVGKKIVSIPSRRPCSSSARSLFLSGSPVPFSLRCAFLTWRRWRPTPVGLAFALEIRDPLPFVTVFAGGQCSLNWESLSNSQLIL